MTHALSSIIGLTNAPTQPRWFEFLLEPGRLQEHLELFGCDPAPILTELSDRLYHDFGNTNEVPIPPDSYEAKYRKKKTYALQTLSVKVASFLKWDLEKLCNGLTIPIQYKLMQALSTACSSETCPTEVRKFAQVIYCHWFLKSAISYRLSALQPQSSSTTIIYLSELQQQQQTADNLALMSMGELFSNSSKQLKSCSEELRDFIWDLVKDQGDEGPTNAKKFKGIDSHPFHRAKFSRPKMECFDSRGEQFNEWKHCEPVEPYDFIEDACYDLGRFYFFEESYTQAKETFEIIKGSSKKFPLLSDYLKTASDILTPDDKPIDDDEDDEFGSESCDNISNEILIKRKQTEKYLFECMTQYSESLKWAKDGANENGNVNKGEIKLNGFESDRDMRAVASMACQAANNSLTENSVWYLQVPQDQQQQKLLEIGRGDALMSRGNFKQAMGCFVGALMLMTDFFRVFSRNYTDEEPCITRMIQCSISLSCYTQAVALCQMTKNLNYTIAFKQLNERICNDCCDDIYECIWNVTLLEYIISLHAKRGEVERRTKVIQLIGQLELNENNTEEILREAEHVRRGRFFRIMSNKYL